VDGFKEDMGLFGQKKEIGAALKLERTENVEVEDGFLLLYLVYTVVLGEKKWKTNKKRTPLYFLFSICSLFGSVTAMSWVIAMPTVVLEKDQFWTVKSVCPRATIVFILSPLKVFGVNLQPSLEYMSIYSEGDE